MRFDFRIEHTTQRWPFDLNARFGHLLHAMHALKMRRVNQVFGDVAKVGLEHELLGEMRTEEDLSNRELIGVGDLIPALWCL